MLANLLPVFERHSKKRESLIPLLQEIQTQIGYLDKEAVYHISRFLGISESDIYGVASFYAQFRFEPQGKYTVRICQGTACHVRGAKRILNEIETQLGIQSKETTKDMKFSLETAACFGACALAPVMVVNKDVHGKLTAPLARAVITSYL